MKIVTFIYIFMLFFGVGCSLKSGFLSEDIMEQNALMHTKKGQLYNSMEIKATITATYLNGIKKEYKNSNQENFLVSIFIDNDSEDPKKHGLFNPNYKLTLNGTKPLKVKVLDFKDDLIKLAPIRNNWSTYYLVSFDKQNSDKLEMIFKNDIYGKVVLEFLEVY